MKSSNTATYWWVSAVGVCVLALAAQLQLLAGWLAPLTVCILVWGVELVRDGRMVLPRPEWKPELLLSLGARVLVVFSVDFAARRWLTASEDFGGWFVVRWGGLLLLTELFSWAFHRACHTFDTLWVFHSVHHLPGKPHAWNGIVFHPLDALVLHLFPLAAAALLDASTASFTALLVVCTGWSCLVHSELPSPSLPLWLLQTPEHHIWHHSANRREQKNNFGGVLAIWDLVFGTLQVPTSGRPLYYGTRDSRMLGRRLGLALMPFLWVFQAPGSAVADQDMEHS